MNFRAEDGPVLRDLGLHEGLDCAVDDRTFMIAPGCQTTQAGEPKGCSLIPSRSHTSPDWPLCIEFDALPYGIEMARFALHEIEGEVSEGFLTFTMDPDHLLPWPAPQSKVDIYEEFRKRMASAVRHGEARIDVPSGIRRRISPKTWKAVLKEVQNEQRSDQTAG